MTDEVLVPPVAIACAAGLNIDDAWTIVRQTPEHLASSEEQYRKVYKRASVDGSINNHYVL